MARGGTVWHSWDCGHSDTFDLRPGRPGAPLMFTPGFDPEAARDGDCFLASKRSANPVLAERDIFVIGTASPWSMDARHPELITEPTAMERVRPYADIWIENDLSTVGPVVRVPGLFPPVGPVSGIYGLTTLWMMTSDACRELSRRGLSVPVDGAGPVLAANAARVSVDRPLGPVWFESFLRSFDQLEGEYGLIVDIGRMAADTVLSGGRVWCWSRDREGLAYEASTRRGGFAFTRGVFRDGDSFQGVGRPYAPKPGDLAIMGIHTPDDPADLDALDRFRRGGMRVAVLGPATRGGITPEGRTVPKEADVHVGRMCDAEGLFALPGFERPVCPVSGAILMQSFWLTALAAAEEIILRTGTMPAAFLSGAVAGGMEHLARAYEIYDRRGY